MVFQLSLEGSFPIIMFITSDKGICTEPKLIFTTKKETSKTDIIIKCLVYVLVIDKLMLFF